MSSSSKKSGGTMGVSQKSESGVSGGPGGNGGGTSVLSKGDSLSTTPSKSGKHSLSKKSGGNGTPNSKLNSSSGGGGGSTNNDAVNPAILNQQALEALYSATYVEDFIDCNDNMGDDLIRQTTRMFEMGSNYMSKFF